MALHCGKPSLEEIFFGAVTVGERGQVVIPAEARKAHGIQPGDKLLVLRHPHAHGLVIAKLDDVRAVLDELQQWEQIVARLAEQGEEESETE
jgi:AbrB family looped-hinge helix DNA binding protein